MTVITCGFSAASPRYNAALNDSPSERDPPPQKTLNLVDVRHAQEAECDEVGAGTIWRWRTPSVAVQATSYGHTTVGGVEGTSNQLSARWPGTGAGLSSSHFWLATCPVDFPSY
jgi:hypothetical protein